ncbi:MAG: hypothetical protein ACYDA1_01725 [Vulcanimicrobiaceae bacterium]
MNQYHKTAFGILALTSVSAILLVHSALATSPPPAAQPFEVRAIPSLQASAFPKFQDDPFTPLISLEASAPESTVLKNPATSAIKFCFGMTDPPAQAVLLVGSDYVTVTLNQSIDGLLVSRIAGDSISFSNGRTLLANQALPCANGVAQQGSTQQIPVTVPPQVTPFGTNAQQQSLPVLRLPTSQTNPYDQLYGAPAPTSPPYVMTGNRPGLTPP